VIPFLALWKVAVDDVNAGAPDLDLGADESALLVVRAPGDAVLHRLQRDPGGDGNAIVTLLAVAGDVWITEGRKHSGGEVIVHNFGFLEHENIRRMKLSHSRELVLAGTDTIDIEGDESHCRGAC
jgi:hypothetical protein